MRNLSRFAGSFISLSTHYGIIKNNLARNRISGQLPTYYGFGALNNRNVVPFIDIQSRIFCTKADGPVNYTPLTESKFTKGDIIKISNMLGKETVINLKDPKVFQVLTEDIELSMDDKYGRIIIASDDSSKVIFRYADYGVMPSKSVGPKDLLKHQEQIPAGVGVLMVKKNTPFMLEAKDPESVMVYSASELSEVRDHEANIQRYSLDVILELSPEQAKQMSETLKNRIVEDENAEYFFEEVTSLVSPGQDTKQRHVINKINDSNITVTLMNFDPNNLVTGESTDMHYHPGSRALIINTSDKPAGAWLNFCGVAEDPALRKDAEQYIEFPKNSMFILVFPPYTHHKFLGEFNCMSIHPKEGQNIINALHEGTLPKAFLESATVFSRTGKGFDVNLLKDKDRESSDSR